MQIFYHFVIVPSMFIYFGVIDTKEPFWHAFSYICFIYYVISGLRRLIQFNINADEGKVEKYTGIPTPLGAIFIMGSLLIFCRIYI